MANRNTTHGDYLYNEQVLNNFTDYELARYARDSEDRLVRELAARLYALCEHPKPVYTGRPTVLKGGR